LGLAVHETEVSPEDPLTADEIFLTGTAAEIDPVAVFDSSSVGEEVQVTSPDRSIESSPKLRRAS